ncbi:hypothetical protein HCN44_001849 [Aphidius gifuensis]|uniref:Methyl-CpG-binding domain protein 3 n=1 Tax=Aphidius gifuensis TaxID=684658 RepID=A0A834Y3S1_APHGI|nr:methyl-CpG-binding domain protein 3 isoform X3 [Aphidius gifuensis]KAF7996217.1 hypothetical protein HCN44_001849 [Aphidius gifuensis]
MNMSVEKRKYQSALPTNWPTRDQQDAARKNHQNQQNQQNQLQSSAKQTDIYYYSRSTRNDTTLVPPIRQTASIFKQPVTIYKTQDGKVKDNKHGNQDKPKQLFWEKRLEGLRACDPDGFEFDAMDLPKSLKPVGPYITEETLLQSVATALHLSVQPVTGQTGSKSSLEKNPGVFLNPDQPLVQAVAVGDDDIKRQEDRVAIARKKLQEALRVQMT